MKVTFESQKDAYLGLINPLIDGLPIYSVNTAKQCIELITTELKALSSQEFIDESAIPTEFVFLRKLFALMQDADLYVYPYHIEEFRALIVARIQEEIDSLSKLTFTELNKLCADKRAVLAHKTRSKKSEQQNFAQALASHSTAKIDPQELAKRRECGIDDKTDQPEAELCTKLSTLINEIQVIGNKCKERTISAEELESLRKEYSIKVSCLVSNELLGDEEKSDELDFKNMLQILRNCFTLFNGSKLSLKSFKKYDNNFQQYILSNPNQVVTIRSLTNEFEFTLCLICLYISSKIDNDIQNNEESRLDAEDLNILEEVLSVKLPAEMLNPQSIHGTLNNIITLVTSNILPLSMFQQIENDTKLMLLRDPDTARELFDEYKLPIMNLIIDPKFVAELFENIHNLRALFKKSELKFADVKDISSGVLLAKIKHADQIVSIASVSDMEVKDILALDYRRFNLIFSSSNNVENFKLLLNFYFIPAKLIRTFDFETLQSLLEKPQQAETLQLDTEKQETEQVSEALNLTLEKLTKSLQELDKLGYLNQIKKILSLPRLLANQLRAQGLDFANTRCLYDILVTLNQSFASSYLCRFMPEFDSPGLHAEAVYNIERLDDRVKPFARAYAAELQKSLDKITHDITDLQHPMYDFLQNIGNPNDTESLLGHCNYRAKISTATNTTVKDLAFCNYAQHHGKIYPAASTLTQYKEFMRKIKSNIEVNIAKPVDYQDNPNFIGAIRTRY